MPLWARIVVFIAIIVLFACLTLLWPRMVCPEDHVWVMSDNKWVCVREGM